MGLFAILCDTVRCSLLHFSSGLLCAGSGDLDYDLEMLC